MPAQIWSAAHANAHIIFSGDALTVTSDISAVHCPVYGLLNATDAGNKYWELVTYFPDNDDGHGIANIASSTDDYAWLGGSSDTLSWAVFGYCYNNGGPVVTNWPSYNPGDRICFAYDALNKLLYGRVENGPWCAGSADPAAVSGGLTIPSDVYAQPVCPAVVLANGTAGSGTMSSQVTGYFAPTSWAYAPPSNFGPWDPAIFPPFPPPNILQKGIR
jgi:hypothetical protein